MSAWTAWPVSGRGSNRAREASARLRDKVINIGAMWCSRPLYAVEMAEVAAPGELLRRMLDLIDDLRPGAHDLSLQTEVGTREPDGKTRPKFRMLGGSPDAGPHKRGFSLSNSVGPNGWPRDSEPFRFRTPPGTELNRLRCGSIRHASKLTVEYVADHPRSSVRGGIDRLVNAAPAR